MTRRLAARAADRILILLLALLATGCAALPTGGGVVGDTHPTDPQNGADLRIWPRKPAAEDSPSQIVEGFLQAAASDEPSLTTASAYLTRQAAAGWHLNEVVILNSSSLAPGTGHSYEITGTPVGTVNDDGVYQPVQGQQKPLTYTFHVIHESDGYRIDRLPPGFGIGLSPEEFRSNYTNYNLYYLDLATRSTSLIPVPLYLRTNTADGKLADQLADQLLDSPVPDRLGGAAQNAAPAARKSAPVTIRQDGTAVITVKDPKAGELTAEAADRLADQLLATFLGISSVYKVEIDDTAGNALGRATDVGSVLKAYHVTPQSTHHGAADTYYLDAATRQVARIGAPRPQTVGAPGVKYGQLAVGISPVTGQPIAAVVDTTGGKLFIGSPGNTVPLAAKYTGTNIRSLTWDYLGHLWFVDTTAGQPTLHRIDTANDGQAEQVPVYGDTGQIQQISVAPDGWRVAVTYGDSPTTTALAIGIVARTGNEWAVDLGFGTAEPVVSQWASITDVDWRTSQTLAILGTQLTTSPLTIYELYPDGSPVVNLADLNAVAILPPGTTSTIAWTQNGPLLAAAAQTISGTTTYEILEYANNGSAWTEKVFGTSPSYAD